MNNRGINRARAERLLPVIKAFAKGRQVERRVESSTPCWVEDDNPDFSGPFLFRLKARQVWVLFNENECPIEVTDNPARAGQWDARNAPELVKEMVAKYE